MPRPSKFPPELKVQIVLRHLRGETQVALRKEIGVSKSTLKTWKRAFLEGGTARLGDYIESNASLLTQFERLVAKIADSVKDWKPDFDKLI